MFTNKIKITGMALLMALSLTACGGGNADENQKPVDAPTASATVSATPTATASIAPAETKAPIAEPTKYPEVEKDVESDEMPAELRAQKQTVADIDLDYAFKNHGDSSVEKVFPSKSFDTKDGVAFGLDFMQDLINSENFYMEREKGSDWEILSSEEFAPRMDKTLLDSTKKNIDKNGFYAFIPTSHYEKGTVFVGKGKAVQLTDIPNSKFNSPDIFVDSSTKTDILYVNGQREMTGTSVEGKEYKLNADYWVGVIPSGNDWKVVNIGWEAQSDNWKAVK